MSGSDIGATARNICQAFAAAKYPALNFNGGAVGMCRRNMSSMARLRHVSTEHVINGSAKTQEPAKTASTRSRLSSKFVEL